MSQTYAGEIRDGVVVFDAGTPPLADGTRVQVEAAVPPGDQEAMRDLLLSIAGQAKGLPSQNGGHFRTEPVAADGTEPKSLAERYAAFIGILQPAEPPDNPEAMRDLLLSIAGRAQGLPPDMAEQHDHYLHGTPKR